MPDGLIPGLSEHGAIEDCPPPPTRERLPLWDRSNSSRASKSVAGLEKEASSRSAETDAQIISITGNIARQKASRRRGGASSLPTCC